MANKLTTFGYFKKRLRDSGYYVDDLYRNYGQLDPRAWSVVIDPGGASVFCTCYMNSPDIGEHYFEIYDGGQFIIPGRVKIQTNSIEVFISFLVNYGITGKAPRRIQPEGRGDEEEDFEEREHRPQRRFEGRDKPSYAGPPRKKTI